MATGTSALGVLVLLIANVPVLSVVLALMAVSELPAVAFMVSEATMLQNGVADQYRGRVLGSYGAGAGDAAEQGFWAAHKAMY